MSNSAIAKFAEPWRRRLHLPAYEVQAAAWYAGTSSQRVARWSKASRLGAVLPERASRKPLSYLELVEVAFVATFRELGVPLQRIRKARQYAAQMFNTEYPFAHLDWKTEGVSVLLDYADADPADGKAIEGRLIAADRDGQMVWDELVDSRFLQFDYEDFEIAVSWFPRGRNVPVKIDPRVAFGAPTVRGLPTWVVKGRWQARETPEEIAEDFGLDVSAVMAALDFEGVDASAA